MVGGTEQDYHYASGLANELSRPSSIREGGTDIATYRYLGLGSVVGVEYPEPAVGLTYQHAGTGDGGDAYTGLDRFGRITDLRWNKGGAALVSSQYGYDRNSNQRWRKDAAAAAAGKAEDQMFWYDGLQQVYQRQRGTLTPGSPPYAGISSLQQTEVFSFDETGNWLGDYNSTGGASGGVLSQSRTHNVANEITSLTNHTAPFSPVQPVYDDAGNTTTVPQPGNWAASHNLKWDAWNRLVEVTNVSTTYQYDALFRRIRISVGGDHDYYYTDAWQVSEVLFGGSLSWRAFWGLRDLNDLIKRDGSVGLGTSLYGLRDKLNFVAVTDTAGAVNLRLAYDTFGQPRYLTDAFAPGSNTYYWNFLFHGYEYDFQSGFLAVRYRTYHPTLGRWLSRDPIGERGGLNSYEMAGNDPVNYYDRLGLERLYGDCNGVIYDECYDCCKDGNVIKRSLIVTDEAGRQCSSCELEEIVVKEESMVFSDGNSGHTWIKLPCGREEGLHPNPESIIGAVGNFLIAGPGATRDDSSHVFDREVKYKACPETVGLISDSMTENSDDWWSVYGGAQNCSSWAVNRLSDGGLSSRSSGLPGSFRKP